MDYKDDECPCCSNSLDHIGGKVTSDRWPCCGCLTCIPCGKKWIDKCEEQGREATCPMCRAPLTRNARKL